MLGHRRRRWPRIEPIWDQHSVIGGHSRAQSRIVVTPEHRAALRHWSGIVTACDATGCLRDTASGWWLSTNAATGHLWTARTSPQRGVFSSGIRLLYHLLCNFAGDAITGGSVEIVTKWIHTYLIESAAGAVQNTLYALM